MIKLDKYHFRKDRIERLEDVVNRVYRPQVEGVLKYKLIYNPINYHPHSSFTTAAEHMALYSLFIDGNINAAKNWFYISELSSLRRYAEFEEGASSFLMGQLPTGFRYLLSDAKHLHPVFSKLRHPDENYLETKSSWLYYSLVRLYQESLIESWDMVDNIISRIKNRRNLKMDFWLEERLGFYEAMSSQVTLKVESSLDKILSKESTKKTNYHAKNLAMGSFMCNPGMWLSKLAWNCGHEIEIDHPMIMPELLPIKPLINYEKNYNFLIDPVLDQKEIAIYGGDLSAAEVQSKNNKLYRKNSGYLGKVTSLLRL